MAKKKQEITGNKKKSLSDILSGIKGMRAMVLEGNTEKVFEVPYRIPFSHRGLQAITGGIMGGKFHEISGDSQSGKSFLLYELIKNTQEMGGYVLLFDGERALEEAYLKVVGIDSESGTLAIEYNMDVENFFGVSSQFIKAVRDVDKKCPVLIGVDSYPAFTIPDAIEEMEKGKDPKGYAAMQKNGKFSQGIEKFIQILDAHDATMVLLNQTRVDSKIMYGDNTITLAENVIKFWCTQRIRGKLQKKLVKLSDSIEIKKGVKTVVGSTTKWTTIKNRSVKPFQFVTTKVRYSTGLDVWSGVDELLVNMGRITQAGTTIGKEGEKLGKPVKGFKLKRGDKFYYDIEAICGENPDLLESLWTGSNDEDGLELEETEGGNNGEE